MSDEQIWIDGYQDWKNMSSCCGGKGVSIWKPNLQRWECSDCGAVTSNDPSYINNNGVKELPYWAQKVPKECDCGGKTAKTTHAFWCKTNENN